MPFSSPFHCERHTSVEELTGIFSTVLDTCLISLSDQILVIKYGHIHNAYNSVSHKEIIFFIEIDKKILKNGKMRDHKNELDNTQHHSSVVFTCLFHSIMIHRQYTCCSLFLHIYIFTSSLFSIICASSLRK